MRKKKAPCDDPNSIGSILRSYGLECDDLAKAIEFQQDNADVFLGEICVELGFVSRETLHTALLKQSASKTRSTGELLRLATDRTQTMVGAVTAMVALAAKMK